MKTNKLALVILDGWGNFPPNKSNAIKLANTPNFDKLCSENPYTELCASGEAVGLPPGLMGNSEVGHLNIGAGRIVYQDIMRVNLAIKENILKTRPEFENLLSYLKVQNKKVHLIGLLSDGGVHTHIDHLFSFLDIFKQENILDVFVHPLLDGRDTPPKSGIKYVKQLQDKIDSLGIGKIATVMGRYYGMDRDTRWDRVKKAYDAMVFGEADYKYKNACEAVESSYAMDNTDEFMLPSIIVDENDNPVSQIEPGDAILFFNFRGDRAREITRVFVDKNFNEFETKKDLDVKFLGLTQYDESLDVPVIFPPIRLENILSQVLAENKIEQLRIAETEKYAHVTFFFNGGEEEPFPFENRILIPSPKVATYDLQPEMSAYEIKNKVIEEINKDKYDVVIMNFANPDMVGHTGKLEETIKAIEVVDDCFGEVVNVFTEKGGVCLITSDHGNAELMRDLDTLDVQTAHTTNNVPFLLVDPLKKIEIDMERDAKLADIAPTMLEILEIDIPEEMTGTSLIKSK